MLHPTLVEACGAHWRQRIEQDLMQQLLAAGWQRVETDSGATWLHPDTHEPYALEDAIRENL